MQNKSPLHLTNKTERRTSILKLEVSSYLPCPEISNFRFRTPVASPSNVPRIDHVFCVDLIVAFVLSEREEFEVGVERLLQRHVSATKTR